MRQTRSADPLFLFRTIAKDLILDPYWHDLMETGETGRVSSFNHVIEVIKPLRGNVPYSWSDYQPGRWTKFLHDYIDKERFTEFLIQLKKKDGHAKSFLFREGANHTAGNCLMGMVATTGVISRLILTSRSCIWLPTGVLDMTLGLEMCHILEKINPGKEVIFEWHIGEVQLHNITTWPWLARYPQLVEDLSKINMNPWQKSLFQGFQSNIHKTGMDVKYKRMARMMRHANNIKQLVESNLYREELTSPTIPLEYYDEIL